MNPHQIEKEQDMRDLFANKERMFRELIETAKSGVYMSDEKGVLFYVNHAFVEMLGRERKDDVIGLNIAKELYADPKERVIFLGEIEKKGFVKDYQVRLVRRNLPPIFLSITSHVMRNESGKVIGMQGIVHDVTDRYLLEERLLLEKLKLEEILGFDEQVGAIHNINNLADFIVLKAATILRAEKCSLMLVDEDANELCIRGAYGLTEEAITHSRSKLGEGIAGMVAQDGRSVLVKNIEYDRKFRRKNRENYKGRSFMSAPVKLKNRVIGVINVSDRPGSGQEPFGDLDLKLLRAIARQSAVAIENAELYKELEYLSVTDPLTSLSNYRSFVKSVDDEIQRGKRFSSIFSILMLDVDNFKGYNDTYGHLEGDRFLKEFSRLLTSNLRSIDKVCRYGGDEFVILLPETNNQQAKLVADKIKALVEIHPFAQPMTASIGVCEYRKTLSRFEFVMRADRAMYQAKQRGKNQVYMYT